MLLMLKAAQSARPPLPEKLTDLKCQYNISRLRTWTGLKIRGFSKIGYFTLGKGFVIVVNLGVKNEMSKYGYLIKQ